MNGRRDGERINRKYTNTNTKHTHTHKQRTSNKSEKNYPRVHFDGARNGKKVFQYQPQWNRNIGSRILAAKERDRATVKFSFEIELSNAAVTYWGISA